ncbi:MAG: NAD(P)-dependent oxidoreductase [Muribaculaceae bacterium]|nr:NAD(P)-dependent oxidoreductase [Muribaculaceae bacterium]
MTKRVLVVGAGGFIGGHIAKEGLNRGYDVTAAVRQSTSRRYLDDPRLKFLTLDYDDPEALKKSIADALPDGERWDYIIYNLGATKCVNFSAFNRINHDYLKFFLDAITAAHRQPERLLFMSSLSALGVGDEKNYEPFTSKSIPMPNTAYGVSKINAEIELATRSDIPYTIFRATGVYGPHEQDYLMMIKCIDRHFDFGVGFKKQVLTFIYVDDLVNAMYDAVVSPNTVKKKYIISEDRSYTQKEFRSIVARLLGKKWVIPIKLPLWMAYVASVVAEKWGAIRMKPSTLNRDKFKIMSQRNWNCDVSEAKADFNFAPRFPLEDGLKATIEAYINS